MFYILRLLHLLASLRADICLAANFGQTLGGFGPALGMPRGNHVVQQQATRWQYIDIMRKMVCHNSAKQNESGTFS